VSDPTFMVARNWTSSAGPTPSCRASVMPTTANFALTTLTHEGGFAYSAAIPSAAVPQTVPPFDCYVSENGKRIGPEYPSIDVIRNRGAGLFAVIGDKLYFSSSDRTDCGRNGRRYEYVIADWRTFYEESDGGHLILTRAFMNNYATHYDASPRYELIKSCKGFSMLHEETLTLLNYFARTANLTILELGPYIGGGTIAMTEGLKDLGLGRLVAVEKGGAHAHPTLPSDDIVRDLKTNVTKYGVADFVYVVEGFTYDDRVLKQVSDALEGRNVGLFVMDADGCVQQNFDLYQSHLADGCLIVLDDYFQTDGARTDLLVRDWVARAVDDGIVKDLGIQKWATWFGVYSEPHG
jgi:predicted O-methyltransferase YrrM